MKDGAAGERAVVLFVVQRTDCESFRACGDLDPKFAAALDQASAAGVEVLVYAAKMSPTAVSLSHRIPWTSAA